MNSGWDGGIGRPARYALMAELVYALASGASGSNPVGVRLSLKAKSRQAGALALGASGRKALGVRISPSAEN